jgi:beta-N-acetylhexosaminidase
LEEARRRSQSERKSGRDLRTLSVLVVLLAALVGCTGVSQGEDDRQPRSENPPGERARETREKPAGVEQMSMRDMVGQMFMISVGGTEPDYYVDKMIRERNIGGVLLFTYNMKSEAQTEALTGSLQELSMETEPPIPLFVAVDQEGGEISHAPWVAPQPAAARVGARGDPAEARAIAERMGRELLRGGVNTDLAPVVDTGFGAAIGARSFGEDPELVAEMGAAAVEGFEEAGVVSAAKHFPNHGPATSDSHETLPVVEHDVAKLRSHDLPPFEAAIDAGVPMVMVGHLLYPAIDPERPASLSPEAVGMLRGELGFDGVVVTDDLAMAGATGGGPPARAAVAAAKAGADLLIISSPPQQQADAYDAVLEAVESGEIPREQVEASVERILKVKEDYSLGERRVR